jgi:hypothetical protein
MRGLSLGAIGPLLRAIGRPARALSGLLTTALQHLEIRHRPSESLAAENLFLREQLALFQEREIKPRRADDARRAAMVWLTQAFDWREALVVVKPPTLIRWHRPGRPAVPHEIRAVRRGSRRRPLESGLYGGAGSLLRTGLCFPC